MSNCCWKYMIMGHSFVDEYLIYQVIKWCHLNLTVMLLNSSNLRQHNRVKIQFEQLQSGQPKVEGGIEGGNFYSSLTV